MSLSLVDWESLHAPQLQVFVNSRLDSTREKKASACGAVIVVWGESVPAGTTSPHKELAHLSIAVTMDSYATV